MLHLSAPTGRVINGRVSLPTSKSITNRVFIIQALLGQAFAIQQAAVCADTQAMQQALQQQKQAQKNSGNYTHLTVNANIGHAGTAMRFLTAYFCLQPHTTILDGSEQMRQRPLAPLVQALQQLGAHITYLNQPGYPPIQIHGNLKPLEGGQITIDASISSQFLSAVLLIAPALPKGLILEWKGQLVSQGYINMTLQVMQYFGVKAQFGSGFIRIKPQTYQPRPIHIPPDWSAASYIYALAALSREASIKLPNLALHPNWQPDAIIKTWMRQLGVRTQPCETNPQTDLIITKKGYGHTPPLLQLPFLNSPDLAQTMAVVCAALNIEGHFTGLQTLRHKETQRITALQTELAKIGTNFLPTNATNYNSATLKPAPLPNHILPCFATYNDHRMALSLSGLAMVMPRGIQIMQPQVVEKSFPTYWEVLQNLGFLVKNLG